MKTLALLIALGFAVRAEEPLRITVLTRLDQAMPEAARLFVERWGAGRIELRWGDFESPPAGWDQADVIFTYLMPAGDAVRLAPQFRGAIARGARVLAHWPEPAQRHFGLKQDESLLAQAVQYWSFGGAENIARCLAFLHTAVAGRPGVPVEAPEAAVTVGIYHPRAEQPFVKLDEYLAWHRGLRPAPEGAPRVAVLFYHTSLKNRDTAHIDALISAIENRGMVPVPVFGWPPPLAEPLLMLEGRPAVEAAFALNLGFAKPDDTAFLKRLNVHVIGLMTTRQSPAEWARSAQGLGTGQLAVQAAAPERAGATDPITFAATARTADGKSQMAVPIPERVDMAVRRAARWIALRRKSNAEKRVAILYYNSPPGKGNIGASYLDVPGTLAAILARLREEGYVTGDRVPARGELLAALERAGRNIEQWAPGELDAIVAENRAVLIPVRQYRHWLAGTPKQFQDAVFRTWGPPERSDLMTIRSRGNEAYCVFPGLRFGNVLLAAQPLRSPFALAGKTLHDTTIPPPHCYIAAYLWMRNVFRADAITHLGRHGTLEFLPGKDVGMAGADAAEVLTGDTPAPYFYIIDGGGESTTARRRGMSTVIGHLTPLLASAGARDEFRALREALAEHAKARDASPLLAEQYRNRALEEIRKLKLDEQLGLDLSAARAGAAEPGTASDGDAQQRQPGSGRAGEWDEIEAKVSAFVEDTESAPIPMGIHTAGSLPREEVQIESLAEFMKAGLSESELREAGDAPVRWAESIYRGVAPETGGYRPGLRDRAQTQIAAGAAWLEQLRASPGLELENYVRVLRGEYLESGPAGDPLRSAASLPSGRNLHDFDPSLIPTPAACEVGRRLGDEVLRRHRERTGRLPEKVSMVLWYGETIRHQGALECQALHLMGVEPQWNSRGVVDGLRLVPETELGRPRVDVVLTIAGIYRDGFPDKALLLDRASKMVQEAGDNTLSRNTRRGAEEFRKAGLSEGQALVAAAARVFGPAPGDYGGGIAALIKQSRDAGNPALIAGAYLAHNNFAYTSGAWGESIPKALETQLKGNEVVIHSRATNLYGVTDNDDFFDFAGGLNVATKTVNGGAAPQFYVANLRKAGRERLEDLRAFLAAEMNGRFWNPKWIREMQRSGYGGAREIFDQLENVYGWQATAPEHVGGAYWDKTYDVYVRDTHNLGLREFFEKENPHARQYMLARMLEVDRQGSHVFAPQQKAQMVREYVRSVARFGVGCSANTCGNKKLQASVTAAARRLEGLTAGERRQFLERLRAAFTARQAGAHVASAGSGGGHSRRAAAHRRPFRTFPVSMPSFAAPEVFVPVGLALFGLFFLSSAGLGAARALAMRLFDSAPMTLLGAPLSRTAGSPTAPGAGSSPSR